MKQEFLNAYIVDLKYVRYLSKADSNVMSISPQIGKDTRPFIGVVVVADDKKYCIPLTSPKSKFNIKSKEDFIKIPDPKLKDENGAPRTIGILNLNNMIPVSDEVITKITFTGKLNLSSSARQLLFNELKWCRDNVAVISNRANKLYNKITQTPQKDRNLTRRCCDFKKLEQVLDKWLSKNQAINTSERSLKMDDLLKESKQILDANPKLKKRFEELYDEYFKRCGISPLKQNAPISERFQTVNTIIASDPAFKSEYIKARENYRGKTQTVPPKKQNPHKR